MGLLQLILGGLKQRGGAAIWAWAGLMLATWLLFAYGTDRPLQGRELIGAGFVHGALVLGAFALVAKWRARPRPRPPSPPPRKQRRKR